jgi:hypothetical protein
MMQLAGCWVDAFELTRFRGRRRRLFGPAVFKSFRSRSSETGAPIDSLIAGPDTYVRLYQASDPDGMNIWVLPRQVVNDLVEIRVNEDVDSIQLRDAPPAKGSSGYAAYLTAKQKSESRKPGA